MTIIQEKRDHGIASLLAVIGFTVISLSALSQFSHHYRQSQQIVMQELEARQAFLLAESALQWGMTISWDLTPIQLNRWQCQVFSADPKIKSCLFFISHDKALLQGQTESRNRYKLYHYQWISFLKDGKQSKKIHISGWLDYCPLVHKECAL